jgi:hypothetical protein
VPKTTSESDGETNKQHIWCQAKDSSVTNPHLCAAGNPFDWSGLRPPLLLGHWC